MKTNVGGLDRIVRILVGLGVLSLVLILEGNARWFGLVGAVPLLTGLISSCPAYNLLGLNTCAMKKRG